jgi:predicted alpha/beta superfamily hydrolase
MTKCFFAVVVAVLLMGQASYAQNDGDPVSIGTYRKLHSNILDEDRLLLVNLPRGYDETELHYPVLYVLYGGQVQGYFAETVHLVDRLCEAGRIPDLIIVGVKNVDRYRDCLPVNRQGEPGGADKFLDFFTEELIPFMDKSYRTKDFRLLLGPQAGASFCVYTLMNKPDLFKVNILTNPFWNRSVREFLLAEAGNFFDQASSLKSFLYITANTSDDNEETMAYLEKFAAIAVKGKKKNITLILNPLAVKEEDIIPSPGLKKGLEAFFHEFTPPGDLEIGGLADLKAYYQQLSKKYGYDVDIPEFSALRQGDILDRRRQTEAARKMYEYVEKIYPHNLNSYFRLAELHRRQGAYDLAIRYYKQFLQRRHESLIASRLNSLEKYISESAAYAVEKAINSSGIDAGVKKFNELRNDNPSQLYFSENEFNALGYGFMGRGMPEAAVEVFKMNVRMHPESANVYDSLGEAYAVQNNRDLAIENYRKSLSLNPDNKHAEEMINKLEEDHNEP